MICIGLQKRCPNLRYNGEAFFDTLKPMPHTFKHAILRPRHNPRNREVEPRPLTIRGKPLCRHCPPCRQRGSTAEVIAPRKAHALLRRECIMPIQLMRSSENCIPVLTGGGTGKFITQRSGRAPVSLCKDALVGTLQYKLKRPRIAKINQPPAQQSMTR